MNSLDYVVDKVLKVIRRDIRKNTSDSYDTGTVKRIDGNIAWVQYDENNPQLTPVIISGASCKKGDEVRIKNNNGTAFILGNDSNPPTDDTKAEHAQVTAEISGQTAKEAQTMASEAEQEANSALAQAAAAKQIADDTEQHFWFTETGTDTGAHITEVPQEEWEDPSSPNYHSGGNLLARSNGIAVREGTTELASFSATGATIGQNVNGKTRAEISTAGLSIVQKIGNVDIGIAVLGYGAGVDENGDPVDVPYYDIGQRAAATTKGGYSVVESQGNSATAYCSHAEGYSTHALNLGAHAEGFLTEATGEYSHVEGSEAHAAGDHSHAEGSEDWAGGDDSHAEGWYTRATGYASHAEGSETTASGASSHAGGVGTKAGYTAQYAIGQYNDNKSTNIFEVGKGTAGAKSNAFEVSNTGDITAPGKATLGAINGDQLFDYTHVSMTSSSIGANASGEVTSSASTKTGYYPIAITNVSVVTGVASLRRFYFSTQETGKAVVKIGVQNDGTSAKTITANADILWVKIAV